MGEGRNKYYYATILMIGIVFVNIMVWQMGAIFSFNYYNEGEANTATLFWKSTKNIDFIGWNSVTSSIKNRNVKLHILKNLPITAEYRIDFTNNSSDISISGLRLYYGIIPLRYFSGEDLYNYIASVGNLRNITAYNGIMYIEPLNEDPIIYFDSNFASLVNREIRNGYLLFGFIINTLIIVCLYTSSKCKMVISKYIDMYDLRLRHKLIFMLKLLSCLCLITSAGLVVYIGVHSAYGAHPDEGMTMMAIDYYLLHWLPPDMRSEVVAGTFSVYGHSRLEEMSIYYFLAGKIGFLFKTLWNFAGYYRVFNLCLYLFMCFIVIKNIWKEPWLIFCAMATPQLCYIFSYATSDGWDYFCSFILIYQVIVKDSILNKALNNSGGKKKYIQLMFFGILSAFIFMGKQNYYVVLLLAFLIFLFKLMRTENKGKKQLMKDYMYILLIFASTFMIRFSFELYHYGFERSEILAQVKEQHAEYQFKKSTALEDKYPGLCLKDQGISLEEFHNRYNFCMTSYKSFCGVYGRMEYYSDSFYYFILGIMYFLLILFIIINAINVSSVIERLECLAVVFVIATSVLLSIYHSWTGDFQPQGRYLLPMLIGGGYLISKVKHTVLETLCILAMAVLSLIVPYGLYEFGVLNLI